MSQPPYVPPQPHWIPNEDYTPPPPGGPRHHAPAPQSPPPPKKKHHWVRNTFLTVVGLVVLIVIIAVAKGRSSSTDTPSVAASPEGGAAAQKASSPAATHPAAFQPQTLLDISGSGQDTTAKFTVGSNGDWDVYWTYNEGSFGQSVNFDFDADGGSDFNVNGPNQLGAGRSGITHVYNDAGTHYLEINSEGNWTVKVVTAP